MPQLITYSAEGLSVATSGEVYLMTVTAASGKPLTLVSVYVKILDVATSNPDVSHRVKSCSAAGTGTSITGQSCDLRNSTSFGATGQKGTYSPNPTVRGIVDAATLAYNSPFYKTYYSLTTDPALRTVIQAGDSISISAERNSATGSATANIYVQVLE